MIQVKRIYDPPSPADGRRILVERLWPRGMKKEAAHLDDWMRDVAPSGELRKWFGHDPARWGQFKQRYFRDLERRRDAVDRLRAEARGRTTFLFAARDTEHNNAVALKEYLEKGR